MLNAHSAESSSTPYQEVISENKPVHKIAMAHSVIEGGTSKGDLGPLRYVTFESNGYRLSLIPQLLKVSRSVIREPQN